MADTYHSLLYHLVFSTKSRVGYITPEIRPRLHDYLGGIVRGEKGVVYEIGGTTDHVHLFIRYRADDALANLVRNVENKSSLWIHSTFPELRDFAWQKGYAAFSVSFSHADAVSRYIAHQERHHKRQDFKTELLALFDRHQMEYDLKYVFD